LAVGAAPPAFLRGDGARLGAGEGTGAAVDKTVGTSAALRAGRRGFFAAVGPAGGVSAGVALVWERTVSARGFSARFDARFAGAAGAGVDAGAGAAAG
jgi:hypothetical protein